VLTKTIVWVTILIPLLYMIFGDGGFAVTVDGKRHEVYFKVCNINKSQTHLTQGK
jgi:hypothetical protein